MNAPKPRAAIAISSIGLAFQLLALLVEIAVLSLVALAPPGRAITFGPFIFFWSVPFTVMGLIFVVLGVAGIAFLNTGKRARVAAGGMMLIISSVFAFPTLFGFFIGSVLMFVGGILAIIWAPVKGV
ncbi:MAG: hypothetical protein ACP5TZ_00985 [Nitrososphaeria archaeon]